ncbi:Pentatricopeptide repeat [Macleaya cordata]|uniref:Pentatricopeptide repeat n=1 Tax=Macleaya cordata TaxID=56857 RepID=A0A200R4Q5_MACCD|nr:Pentatricopeptide repeat [Macleaya cordata]
MRWFLRSLHRSFCSWQWHQQSFAEKLSLLSMEGRLDEAIRILRRHPNSDLRLNSETYLPLIRSCIKFKAFTQGEEIHKHIIQSGVEPDLILQNNIMMLYSKFGNLELTQQMFDEMTERNLFSWTAIIGAYANSGDAVKAFEFYKKMIMEGIRADNFLYPLVFKSCSGMKDLKSGKRVHADVIRNGFEWDLFITNSLIDMYTKCESLGDAKRAFDETAIRDIFTWTTMLVGYVQMGHGLEALELFKKMMHSEVRPKSASFSAILPVFSVLRCLKQAKQIHGLAIVSGFGYDKFVGTALVDMYANFGGLGYGRFIFDRVKEKDVVCWNTMIKGYAQMELFEEAFELLNLMQINGINPNKTTWDCIIPQYLQSESSTRVVLNLINQLEKVGLRLDEMPLEQMYEHINDIQQVKELHSYLGRGGYITDSGVASSLIQMYSKFAEVEAAQQIFDCIGKKKLDCWNSIIACYSNNRCTDKALKLFELMLNDDIEPDLQSWNTLISGLIDVGDFDSALEMFSKLKWTKQNLDPTTVDVLLPLIRRITCSMVGKQLHNIFLRNQYEMSRFVCTAFINMYGNCQEVAYAIKLFESMDSKDLVSWNAIISSLANNGFLNEASKTFHEMKMAGIAGNIITWTALVSGYAQHGEIDESLKHFRKLQMEGLKPNSITISSILPACAQSATLSHGKSIYGYITRSGLGFEDLFVMNALMDMFVKCGSMDYAERVFRRLSQRDIISWNTMIQGFGIHGKARTALSYFDQMLAEGVDPDSVTFIGVLSACSHGGLVEEGWKQFNSMESKYGEIPSGKHYSCMVDLLGRAGNFEDVKNFIVQMPLQPTASLWGALLSACKTHKNVEMAEFAAGHLMELQPKNPGNYVILSNIYAAAGRWKDVDRLRKVMVDNGIKKLPGSSWVEIGNCIYAFSVEDQVNQNMEEISRTLQDLATVMIEEGYDPKIEMDSFGDNKKLISSM